MPEPARVMSSRGFVGAVEARPEHQARAGQLRFRRQPAQQFGRVGRLEVIAGGGEIERAAVRRIEPHAAHLAHQMRRDVEIVGGFLDQDAGGAHARAGLRSWRRPRPP